jgi:hypothetical protein
VHHFWEKIAAIGGSPISPSGSAEVTVPAGAFDTTLFLGTMGKITVFGSI